MISLTADAFWDCFHRLPEAVQRDAEAAYALWQINPHHRSLQYKRVKPNKLVYSVRVGLHWRALGLVEQGTVTWFWIGSHADYDGLIARL